MAVRIVLIEDDGTVKKKARRALLVLGSRDEIQWKVDTPAKEFWVLVPGGGVFAKFSSSAPTVPISIEEPELLKITGTDPVPAIPLKAKKEFELKNYILSADISQLTGFSFDTNGDLVRITAAGGDPPEIIIGS